MDTFQLITLVQAVIMALCTLGAWSIMRAFRSGQWAVGLENRLTAVEKRMDKAGEKISDLATFVQGVPELMRKEFLLKERADELLIDSREDRRKLWEAIQDLQRQGRR